MTPPAHEHRARVDLPDWMRNPERPRRTPGRLLSELVDHMPVLRAARRRLWAWRDNSRFSDRHPVVAAIVSFALVWATATLLVGGAMILFHRIMLGQA